MEGVGPGKVRRVGRLIAKRTAEAPDWRWLSVLGGSVRDPKRCAVRQGEGIAFFENPGPSVGLQGDTVEGGGAFIRELQRAVGSGLERVHSEAERGAAQHEAVLMSTDADRPLRGDRAHDDDPQQHSRSQRDPVAV